MNQAARALVDHYPSRQQDTPGRLPRREPVLHGGDTAPGPLSIPGLRAYDHDGYLVCSGLFSADEVAELQAEVERRQASDRESAIIEPDGQAVRSLFGIHHGDGPLARALRDARLVGRVEQILAGPSVIHQSRVNLKPGFDGREFAWHSDFETWHVEDGMPAMHALSAMILLTANTAANGPLLVIPGSHREFITCVGDTPEDHHLTSLRRQEYGTPDRATLTELAQEHGVEAVLGKPGDVVLFDCNLLHGSGGNLSPLPRSNLFAVYNACSNALVAPFGGRKARPSFVTDRNTTPLSRASGGPVA